MNMNVIIIIIIIVMACCPGVLPFPPGHPAHAGRDPEQPIPVERSQGGVRGVAEGPGGGEGCQGGRRPQQEGWDVCTHSST